MKINNLEELFTALGCKKYEKDGKLTDKGEIVYGKLIRIIYYLESIGVVKADVDGLDKYVDEVIGLGQ